MKNERPCGARHKYKRRAPRTPAAQPQTARHGGSAKIRSGHPTAHGANVEGGLFAPPAAQPQTAGHSGSVAGSRGAHADGGTRHRTSSRRWHRPISPGCGVGSRGATVGRPSAHCASPRRHSGPRPRQPHRPSSRAPSAWATAPPARGRANQGDPKTLSPSMKAQTAWEIASPDERNEQPVRGRTHPPQAPTHRAPPRAHPTQPRAHLPQPKA